MAGRFPSITVLLQKSFWIGEKVAERAEVTESEDKTQNREMFEEKPQNLPVGISVRNLFKSCSWWKKKGALALDNVNFDFYEGEITGLLGHNGAGKTTLISILCGMIPASSGKIIIKGADVTRYRNQKNHDIGYCPQFEILLEGLSLRKNLIFFGMAKNLSRKAAANEAEDLMGKLGLTKSRGVAARNLSGGQRKRLSLGIALIGNSSVIILDEPSTGIDIKSRHEMRELLLQCREKRTVILSTHFMEEADALCDRISVISHGQIRAYGTPMFLKSKFGMGYTLSVVIPDIGKTNATTDLVKSKIKGAVLKRQNVLTVSYQLPEKEMSTFPDLFDALENQKKNGEIVSYSANVATLEDVFLNIDKVLKDEYAAKKGILQEPVSGPPEEDSPKTRNFKGIMLLFNQIGGLLIKKCIFVQRNLPFFLVLVVFTLALDAIFDFVVHHGKLEPETKSSVDYKYQKTQKEKSKHDNLDGIAILRMALFPFSYSLRWSFFLIIFFVFGIVQERNSNLKTFQLMLVSPIIYWISHLLFDFTLFVSHTVLSLIILGASSEFKKQFLIDNIGRIAAGVFFHQFSMLLISYIGALISRRIVVALLYPLLFYVFGIILGFPIPFNWYYAMKNIFPTSIVISFFSDIENEMFCKWVEEHGSRGLGPLDLAYACYFRDGLPTTMTIYSLILILLVILADSGILPYLFHQFMTLLCCISFKPMYSEHETVEKEKEKVGNLKQLKQLSSKVLTVDRIRRWYCSCKGTKRAVQGVSFTVEEHECFALLGVNGAGKSTIFKVLTGVITPTKGNVFVRSTSVLNFVFRHKTFPQMGYCPQYGNYLPKFKGREMIELFGRLRGMRGSHLKKEVEKHIKQSFLEEHERAKCSTYSGGTLRKLSVVIAMIGEPSAILLDEPTTGIDPAARRSIWDLMILHREEGHAVVLTSHSMEECEALCTRVGIMTDGQLRAVGETTTLKSLFGQTFSVLLKTNLKATDEDRSKLKKAVIDTFGSGCHLVEEHLSIMQYQIPMESTNWKKLFLELNSMKSKFSFLESFSASSTTLEQVFMHFTKNQ